MSKIDELYERHKGSILLHNRKKLIYDSGVNQFLYDCRSLRVQILGIEGFQVLKAKEILPLMVEICDLSGLDESDESINKSIELARSFFKEIGNEEKTSPLSAYEFDLI